MNQMNTRSQPLAKGEPVNTTQESILDYMQKHLIEYDNMPTMRSIAGAFGWSSQNSAVGHVNSLIDKGWIERVGVGHAYRFKRRGK